MKTNEMNTLTRIHRYLTMKANFYDELQHEMIQLLPQYKLIEMN